MLSALTDVALVERARAGDPRALDALVRRHRDRIYRRAYRVTLDRNEAEDVLQDVMLIILRKLGSFRHEAQLATWLHRVATNAALMRRRRMAYRRTEPIDRDP